MATTIRGTDRNDELPGTTADDNIYGFAGDAGSDILYGWDGGDGNDVLTGGGGSIPWTAATATTSRSAVKAAIC